MKRLYGLLFGLSMLLTYSVSAETIDMNYENFTPYSIHKSGDIYENVSLLNGETEFSTPEGHFFYRDRNALRQNADAMDYLQFKVINQYGQDFYDVEDGSYTKFIIPTYYNEKPLWLYEKLENVLSTPASSGKLGDTRHYYDSFRPFISEPKFVIECEEQEAKVGNTVKCSLKYKYSLYSNIGAPKLKPVPVHPKEALPERRKKDLPLTELNYGIHPLNVDLTLISPDYVINNINESFISNLQIDDTHVKGLVYDSERVYEAASYYSYSQMKNNISDNLKYEEEEIYRTSCSNIYKAERSSESTNINEGILGGSFEHTEDGCIYKVYKINYEFTVLTFDAIPKDDASDIGSILASNAKFKLYNSEEQKIVGDLDYATGDAQIDVPITGLVKGVEEVQENPKTGIFNTLLLIIPILLFGLGYYLIMKKNIFKFNK